MKNLIALIFMLIGILGCIYFGGWVMFVGGIIQIVDTVKSGDISGLQIAFGSLRIIFAGLIGCISFIIPGVIGAVIGNS